jgi:hypothetical protein
MLRNIAFPRFMKNLLQIFAFAVCGFTGTTFADDFKSVTITGGTPLGPIRVHGDQFMVIRNFTQDGVGGGTRGFVTVFPPLPSGVNVLAAAIIDPNSSSLDVINNVVVAGPADVMVTCDPTAICFISYKKDSN